MTGSRESTTSRRVLGFFARLLEAFPRRDFAVRLWNGEQWAPEPAADHRFALVINDPSALRRAFLPPDMVALGEALMLGDIDVEGDMVGAIELGDYLLKVDLGLFQRLGLAYDLLRLPSSSALPGKRPRAELSGDPGSRERLRAAISYHYDLPVDFWSLWLDPTLSYSCAYFEQADVELSAAQVAKLDLVCRKLYLEPGERLVDLGCGWGALMRHAARHYGVQVVGVTLSGTQADHGRERIAEEGLATRCEVVHGDFRDAADLGPCDKVASIGAVEHIPKGGLGEYFGVAWKLLAPGGLFLSHGITSSVAQTLPKGPSFVDRYVFPDHAVIPLSETLPAAEGAGFEIRDIECLREHYALTCLHWLRRLEANREPIEETAGGEVYRLFRLYLAAMSHYFSTGVNSLHQVLLSKPAAGGDSSLPLTRSVWYPGADNGEVPS